MYACVAHFVTHINHKFGIVLPMASARYACTIYKQCYTHVTRLHIDIIMWFA